MSRVNVQGDHSLLSNDEMSPLLDVKQYYNFNF